ncbi:GGDEF domain-containing protein [Pseudobutyrivibrio xylanivorans]|uniref:Diguanylate cyclase (GGDEF) domain-containing protein n=1 Tax=Pseudobutyrivibrio xylanivorans DSM 14809 TaxID=1123012 RepID=A0A1M6FB57_PSEXY|nr:GGDEF domain-containing protein [Pseudobutyrivibrio xylanivorans]SHI94905.1 diguanylate cyclase (GGDEF) domain-containing protein [Pseudobutyrivibrio xylanivorans DSM 14809]
MGLFGKYSKINREELDSIKRYFAECLPSIDDNNLHMLRKACMYISMVYVVMIIVGKLLLEDFTLSIEHFGMIPLMAIYFNINLYTLRHKGEISTAKTAAICCTFYFFLGVVLGLIDVFDSPTGQSLWLPIACMGLPMIFIDRIYKYAFEEAVVLSIMLTMSFFQRDKDGFLKDIYIAISAYFVSLLFARIILEVRAKEALAMQEVTKLSSLDKLTHILNKNALIERIDNYFDKKSPEECCAMAIIDLDDFKLVNDNLGHHTGDLLLEKVGQLLVENFRAYDLVGRYGGDEFVVLMPRMADVNILANRCKALQMYINDLDIGSDHRVTASIGAVICKGAYGREEIFSMADDALYKSKIQGKNCCTTWVYTNEPVERDILIVMTSKVDEGVKSLLEGEGDRFGVIHAANDDDVIRDISRYHDDIKIIMLEVDVETGTGVFVLKYLKKREGFAKIPVIAVVNTQKAAAMAEELSADAVISSDEPDSVFKETIDKCIKI